MDFSLLQVVWAWLCHFVNVQFRLDLCKDRHNNLALLITPHNSMQWAPIRMKTISVPHFTKNISASLNVWLTSRSLLHPPLTSTVTQYPYVDYWRLLSGLSPTHGRVSSNKSEKPVINFDLSLLDRLVAMTASSMHESASKHHLCMHRTYPDPLDRVTSHSLVPSPHAGWGLGKRVRIRTRWNLGEDRHTAG